jgi:hypothetical protein
MEKEQGESVMNAGLSTAREEMRQNQAQMAEMKPIQAEGGTDVATGANQAYGNSPGNSGARVVRPKA